MSLHHPTPNYATPPRTAPIISEGFPYWVNHYPLHAAPDHSYPWHWHTELELFYIHEGAIDYYVPSGLFRAQQGDVGLINSGALHMTRCSQNQISIAAEHIFSPIFISAGSGSDIETKYVLPITNSALDLVLLPAASPIAQQIRPLMQQIYDVCQQKEPGFEILTRSLISEVWLLFYQYIESRGLLYHSDGSTDSRRVKEMMHYIHQHYASKITLDDIAQAAHIGARECCRCFQRQLGLSPFEYLIDYRIGIACTMLRQTDLSIMDIANQSGFSGSSYFGKLFKEKLHCSPSYYRRKCKKNL